MEDILHLIIKDNFDLIVVYTCFIAFFSGFLLLINDRLNDKYEVSSNQENEKHNLFEVIIED